MRFSIYQASRQGGRKYNQDRVAYSYSKEALLMVLADGMGGHLHGEVAAQVTVQMLTSLFQNQAKPKIGNPFMFLSEAIQSAHMAVNEYAAEHELLDAPRTTIVACLVQDDHAYWAHVGDSRLYHIRGTEIVGRTRDHSRVQQLYEDGKITEQQLATHPDRNKIYNCLGGYVTPEVDVSRKIPLQEGDSILICTDGLWSMMTPNEIVSIFQAYPLQQAVLELLDHAEFRGGEDGDNLSAVGMTWGGSHRLIKDEMATAAMPMDQVTTLMDNADFSNDKADLSDNEIEQAIAEIQEAIQRYTRNKTVK